MTLYFSLIVTHILILICKDTYLNLKMIHMQNIDLDEKYFAKQMLEIHVTFLQ